MSPSGVPTKTARTSSIPPSSRALRRWCDEEACWALIVRASLSLGNIPCHPYGITESTCIKLKYGHMYEIPDIHHWVEAYYCYDAQ